MLNDIRDVARLLLSLGPPTREGYIADVVRDARKKHGDGEEVRMMAERTARYLWELRRGGGRVRH